MTTPPQIQCPTCSKRFQAGQTDAMPFCSRRCQQIDLGRWVNEEHGLPIEELGPDDDSPIEEPDNSGNNSRFSWGDDPEDRWT